MSTEPQSSLVFSSKNGHYLTAFLSARSFAHVNVRLRPLGHFPTHLDRLEEVFLLFFFFLIISLTDGKSLKQQPSEVQTPHFSFPNDDEQEIHAKMLPLGGDEYDGLFSAMFIMFDRFIGAR